MNMSNDVLMGWSNQDPVKMNYFNVCNAIAVDDTLFHSFKQNQDYVPILEHVSYSLGLEYEAVIDTYPESVKEFILGRLAEIKENDRYGSPLMYHYNTFGMISPTTIRYIKVLMDLYRSFLSELNGKHIVEIGGGYGGQCLLISKVFDFASYTILDLESVTKLQNKYLQMNNVANAKAMVLDEFTATNQPVDFVISNYAFAELNKEWQEKYMEQVVNKAKAGYMQINPDASECYNAMELKAMFMQFPWFTFMKDEPMNNYYPNNFTFMFGGD